MCWYVVSPIFVLVIWSFNWYDIFTTNEIITYGDYKFNNGAMGFGWGIAIVSICAIPAGAVHTIYKLPSNLSLSEKFKLSIKPTIADPDLSYNKCKEDSLDLATLS